MADECGAGILLGEILPVLRSIDNGIGAKSRLPSAWLVRASTARKVARVARRPDVRAALCGERKKPLRVESWS
jgi:hypothetical protein